MAKPNPSIETDKDSPVSALQLRTGYSPGTIYYVAKKLFGMRFNVGDRNQEQHERLIRELDGQQQEVAAALKAGPKSLDQTQPYTGPPAKDARVARVKAARGKAARAARAAKAPAKAKAKAKPKPKPKDVEEVALRAVKRHQAKPGRPTVPLDVALAILWPKNIPREDYNRAAILIAAAVTHG